MAERGLRLQIGSIPDRDTARLLAGLVVFFGRAPDLFSNKASYTVIFPEAPGIGPGTPIRKSGVRIGEVSGRDLDPQTGQVRIQIRVDHKFLPRKTEEATITRGLLSGDAAIDFLPRLAEEGAPVHPGDVYPPGSEIVGVSHHINAPQPSDSGIECARERPAIPRSHREGIRETGTLGAAWTKSGDCP